MKKTKEIKIITLLLMIFVFSSCDVMKDLQYTVTPNPLEMHGDSVRVSVTAVFPKKGIHKKAKAEITPMLGNTELKSIVVLGEKATGNADTRIKYKPGGTVSYSDVVKYKPEFEVTDLMVTGKVYKGSKEKEKIKPIKIADGTIITPLLVKKEFKVIMSPDNFQRVTEKKFTAQINYEKAKSDVRPAELKDKDIFELGHWLAAAQTNPKITIKSINIVGHASPEGEVGSNNNLSSERASSAKVAVTGIANKSNNAKAQTEIYNLNGSGEDWEGFKAELEKSSMNQDEKNLIIRVLEMYKDPMQRETEIRNMAKTFVFLEKNILPQLRRSEIIVVYDEVGYTDEELIQIAKSTPEKLTVEELLFTATLLENLDEKYEIYSNASNLFPLDIRTHNNTGAVLYMQGKYTEAGYKFDAANSLEDNPISKNNLGALEGTKGNTDKAKELFKSASGAGSEVSYNLGYYDILENRYAKAISNFGTDASFNKALAELLNGNNDAAMKTIESSTDKETGIGFYLKAVINARQNNVSGVVTNLKSAFAKDPSLKAKAMRDREFLKYSKDSGFSALAN
jgi:tetratricopeptide (TPR) repeat protein